MVSRDLLVGKNDVAVGVTTDNPLTAIVQTDGFEVSW